VALDVSTSSPLSVGEEIVLPAALGAGTSSNPDTRSGELHTLL
jgi:hypothetical protein